ncbi:DUF2786 domain-containing protein [Conexibacter sp. S30A1]|uniref:DUF2786 domain-containing protein n=1 Tax=Conexibacter sp. S30A1 TaxID=2937800 RepID=UPI00200FF88A|nr:DUF2786 domain-containing protein [Conexibacter sp. S30A1]
MGKNNRQRRAAKVRKRAQARRSSGEPRGHDSRTHSGFHSWDSAPADLSFTPRELFLFAVWERQSGSAERVTHAVTRLASAPPDRVGKEVAESMESHIADLWEHGWQPADVDRIVLQRLGADETRLVRLAIASQSRHYEALGRQVQPGWMAQLERIGARRDWPGDELFLRQLGDSWPDALTTAVTLMALLMSLPRLPHLVDPPGHWRQGWVAEAPTVPPAIFGKVRALLAKAESTTFDAEAEALTAKAQELMARHRIDRALLEHDLQGSRIRPVGRRIGVDDPYAEAKALMLGEIATANGCHAVWSKSLGFTTVFGFADELDAVEELFTSLLVQATVALRREGSKVDRHGRSRTTRFRRSFLVAFGVRIGRRLRATVAATVTAADAETALALVPILAERDAAAKQAASAAFPEAGQFSPAATDGEGWYAGTLFGDLADLGIDAIESERAA